MLFNSIWAIWIWMLLYENAWEQIYYVAKIEKRKNDLLCDYARCLSHFEF